MPDGLLTEERMLWGGVDWPIAYGYNVLDNLTTMKVTGGGNARDHTYVYDSSNRLANIKNTVGGAMVVGLGYDVQGNLANKNGQIYSFDFGNRLRAVSGGSVTEEIGQNYMKSIMFSSNAHDEFRQI